MQRWAAEIAIARAGQQGHGGLNSAGQPHRCSLAPTNASGFEIGRQPVGGGHHLPVGDPTMPVTQREAIRRARGVPRRQGVDRIRPPMTGARMLLQTL